MVRECAHIPISAFSANPANGCITSIECGGVVFTINGWGCEFGNWHGYFSQDKIGGTLADVLDREIVIQADRIRSTFDVRLPGARFRAENTEWIEDGTIVREYSLSALEDSLLGDFVIRAALRAETWKNGYIGGYQLFHNGSNNMVQLPAEKAFLRNDDKVAAFALSAPEMADNLDVLTYLRDEPTGLWIVHHRMLTRNDDCDEYVLRFGHVHLSSLKHRGLSFVALRKCLWRLAERHPGIRPTIQLGGNIVLRAGASLSMKATISIHEIDRST